MADGVCRDGGCYLACLLSTHVGGGVWAAPVACVLLSMHSSALQVARWCCKASSRFVVAVSAAFGIVGLGVFTYSAFTYSCSPILPSGYWCVGHVAMYVRMLIACRSVLLRLRQMSHGYTLIPSGTHVLLCDAAIRWLLSKVVVDWCDSLCCFGICVCAC